MYSYNKLGIVHCKYMYLGVSGYNFKKCIFLSEDLLYLYKQSTDPDEIQHFIWVPTVCKSTFFLLPKYIGIIFTKYPVEN